MNGQTLRYKHGKWGFVDDSGATVIPFKYDYARNFSEELAAVELNSKYGFIDKTGREVIPLKYNFAGDLSEGLAAVKLNDKWGYVDKTGATVIPIKYDNAKSFSEGLARVELNGKWGYIDKTGKEVVPVEYSETELDVKKRVYLALNRKFSVFAKPYVEPKINEWQKKGEFEKTADWQQRVNESTRQQKINEYLKEAEVQFLSRAAKSISHSGLVLKDYDADNESFLAVDEKFGQLLIAVPHAEAPQFKENWSSMKKTPKYFVENDRIALAELSFTQPDGKVYKYSNQHTVKYETPEITYHFDPIEINTADNSSAPKGQQNISTVNLNIGKSDVDTDIPTTGAKNDKTFAVIIANEKYQSESQVEFASGDGATFKEYCTKTLGLPEKNVHYLANATLNNIRAEINWISSVANAFSGEAKLIFYYAGHGIPDEDSKTAYLLPVDGYGSDVTTGYKLDDLYQKLGALPAQSVTVFMDACFSGAQRSGDMLASARGVAIKAAQGKPSGNMVVFSAAQGDETAYPYREKGHGLFTYFLLKKLQETQGEVTLSGLGEYITKNVKQQSILVNRKSQTPTVIPSPSLTDWQSLKLK
jgi:hypothetical protein